jgi:hypothetical protein
MKTDNWINTLFDLISCWHCQTISTAGQSVHIKKTVWLPSSNTQKHTQYWKHDPLIDTARQITCLSQEKKKRWYLIRVHRVILATDCPESWSSSACWILRSSETEVSIGCRPPPQQVMFPWQPL